MGRIQKIQKIITLRGGFTPCIHFMVLLLPAILSGCVTYKSVKPDLSKVALISAEQNISEEQLLDVRIQTFDPGTLPASKNAARGLSGETRQAEAHYVAVQIRSAMQQTGHWGAVRVVPNGAAGDELQVFGRIIKSNGEELDLQVSAKDARGNYWFKDKRFKGSVTEKMYKDAVRDKREVFQNVYNRIANELSRYHGRMSAKQVKEIRQLAEMRFASELAPDVFGGYIRNNKRQGRFKLDRLPPEGDELYEWVLRIRERNYMLVDTLDAHYENLHKDMKDIYTEWRKSRLTEMNIIREIDTRKNWKIMKGTGIMAGTAILNAILNKGNNNSVVTTTTVVAAVTVTTTLLLEAEKIREEAQINKAAIEELGESFADDIEPTVIKVEGEVVKLTGSAEEKYRQWRDIMKELYKVETGGTLNNTQPNVINGG